jgi:hypothetical protein
MAESHDVGALLCNGAWCVTFYDNGCSMILTHDRPDGIPDDKCYGQEKNHFGNKITVMWDPPVSETNKGETENG